MDEQRNEAINLEEVDPNNFGTLITLSQYRDFQSNFPTEATEQIGLKMKELAEELAEKVTSSRKYNVYSDKQKSVFFYSNRIKLWKAAPSALRLQVEIREPLKAKKMKIDRGRKRKRPAAKKMSRGTVTGQYMRFISKILDEMDKSPELNKFYIFMNNATIRTLQDR